MLQSLSVLMGQEGGKSCAGITQTVNKMRPGVFDILDDPPLEAEHRPGFLQVGNPMQQEAKGGFNSMINAVEVPHTQTAASPSTHKHQLDPLVAELCNACSIQTDLQHSGISTGSYWVVPEAMLGFCCYCRWRCGPDVAVRHQGPAGVSLPSPSNSAALAFPLDASPYPPPFPHQGQGQAAIDVLRSGLSMVPDPAAGYDSGRLHMALSEAFAAEHDWVS